MKKLLYSLLFLFAVNSTTFSQENNDKPDGSRLEALKIAYLTKRLNLTPEEAQRFWPIYNNYAGEIRKVRIDQRKNKSPEIETEEKILQIRKKYNSEFSSAISAEKIDMFFRSEKDFGSYVQKELMERRQLRQQPSKQRLQQ